jgi:hypothetical protein
MKNQRVRTQKSIFITLASVVTELASLKKIDVT